MRSVRRCLVVCCVLLVSWGGVSTAFGETKQDGGSAAGRDYAKMAEATFMKGEQAFRNEDWEVAKQYYTYVRNRYPYSRYAALSEIRVGDVYYETKQYASAIQQYQGFVRLYPKHPEVVYATYKRAQAYVKTVPEEPWFILPPAYEVDLKKAELAEAEMQYFLKNYPKSAYEKEAREALSFVKRRLADHELYGAKFYMERGNFIAGVWRLMRLLERYSGVGVDDEALILLARCQIELKDMEGAFAALVDLVKYHPNSSYAQTAREYLEEYRPEALKGV